VVNKPRGDQDVSSVIRLRDSELPSLVPVPVAPETQKGRRIALSVLLFASFAAAAYVASPLWVGMAFGTVMAFTMQGPYRRLCARLGEKRGPAMAATVVTVGTGVTCLALVSAAAYVVTNELVVLAQYAATRAQTGSLEGLFGDRFAHVLVKAGANPDQLLAAVQREAEAASHHVAAAAGAVMKAGSSIFLGLLTALVTMFYVLVDWSRLACRLERVLPLDPRHTRALILEVREVGRDAFVGTVATAVIQGILAGLGYWALGVPRPAAWGALTCLGSLVPVVGSMIVWGSISVWLGLEGHPVRGIALFLWGVLIVTSMVDYVIRPRIVGRTTKTHPLLMLVSLLGGTLVLGLPGLIVGPIVMAFFVAVLRLHERETDERAPRERVELGSTAE